MDARRPLPLPGPRLLVGLVLKPEQNIRSNEYVEGSTPPLQPPNGSQVTTRDLYAALYQMDQRLADRDTAFMNQLNTLGRGLENHRSDYILHSNAEVIKEEIKLDAKKVGVAAAALTVLGTLASLFVAVIRGHLGV